MAFFNSLRAEPVRLMPQPEHIRYAVPAVSAYRRHGRTGRPFYFAPCGPGRLRGAALFSAMAISCLRLMRALLFILLMPLAAGAQASDLERIPALIKGGALGLAQSMVERNQPSPRQTELWMTWERQRYAVYFARGDWDGLAQRVAALPEDLPDDFRRWALTQGAWARLSAGDGEGARRFLRDVLWQTEVPPTVLSEARQLVIRSYLVDDNLADAQTAVLRYKQDYQASSDSWQELHATILLRANQPRNAMEVLAGVHTHEGRLLALLAALQSRAYAAPKLLELSQALTYETRNKPRLNYQAWVLAAMSALRANERLPRSVALERALTLQNAAEADDKLFKARADDLWQAYDRLAETAGKAAHLTAGNDAAWVKKAESYKRDDAASARAFYAYLSSHAKSATTRALAHQRLAASLTEDGRDKVLRRLYTGSTRYLTLDAIPTPIRYRMLDAALGDFDIDFAVKLLKGLEATPQGQEASHWKLRRARILIYAGDYNAAESLLRDLLCSISAFDEDFAERYLQVLFDLQLVGHHQEVLALLDSVFYLVDTPRLQREILYWMAESRVALGQNAEAAELYLRSATFDNPYGGDMWGQSARFHAAESLAKAGLTADARDVYSGLLKFTEDPKRRVLLERNIQQLWLIEKKTTTP